MLKAIMRLLVVPAALAAAISAQANTGVIEKVLSGDLIQIGDTFVARFTGITAPSRNEGIGYQVYDFTKRELEGQLVKIFTWTRDNTRAGIVYDEKGYPFVQIYYGRGASVSFNEVLLRKGYARVDSQYLPDDLKHYLDLEKEAREKGLGIWKIRKRIAADSAAPRVPRLEGIAIDGASADWGNRGFRVEYLTDPDGRTVPVDDFDVKFRLGWNLEGLLVLALVRDDSPVEHVDIPETWEKDCLELIMADGVGSDNRCQLVIASGADPAFKTVRTHFFDWRPESRRGTTLTSRVSSLIAAGGYTVEALLPWENLGIQPGAGLEFGFQFVANDEDSLRVGWFPAFDPSNPGNVCRIRLDDKPGEPVLFRVDREILRGRCTLSLRGSDELIGEKVEVWSGQTLVVSGKMELLEGRSGFSLSFPALQGQESWPRVEVRLEGKAAASFEALPVLEKILARYLEALGGEEAVARIQTRKFNGNLIHEYPGQNPPKTVFPAEVLAAVPDKWRLILKTSKGLHQIGSDGERGFSQDADRVLIDNGQLRSRLAFLFDPRGALRLEDYFAHLDLKEKTDKNGRPAYVVKSTAPNGARRLLYFDAESGLLTRIGDDLEVRDYREKDGVLHPARIVIARKGGTSTYVFDSIETSISLAAGRFVIPDMGQAFPNAFDGLADSRIIPLLKDFPSTHEEMSAPCRDGRFLHDLIIRNGYRRGLEIGTYTGYSALWMGLAFEKTGGKLVTIEYDPASGGKARDNILKAGLGEVVDLRIADAFAEIPRIEGPFDFVFIDAWKPDYIRFLSLVKDRVLPGGAIVAHNVTNLAPDMREFLEAIRNDPDLETTFHEISAEGMSVSLRRRAAKGEGYLAHPGR